MFSSWASEFSSITHGRLVVFTRPPMTGPATAKHARSTGFRSFARNSFAMACRLGKSALGTLACANGTSGPASLEKIARSVFVPPMSPAMSIVASPFFALGLCVPLAIWFRSAQPVVQDVQVADHWDHKCMVKSKVVGHVAHHQGHNCSAHDGHIQDTGPASRQRP